MDSSTETPQLMYPAPLAAERGQAIHINGDTHADFETPILIVGGGPVGMLQALLLARLHGQHSMVIEREATTTQHPKMEYTNGRSMEIYRKMGLGDSVRAMASELVAESYSFDELIVTSMLEGGHLVHVWERDSPEQTRKKSKMVNDGTQYLEPHMRCHQIPIERWLKKQVEAEEMISSHWSTAFVSLKEASDHVLTEIKTSDGSTRYVKSQYVVGCDGGGSWVRKSVGLESKRNYMDMTMAIVHFRSAALRDMIPFPQRFWHANIIGSGLLVCQNEADLWTTHFLVPPGVDATNFSSEELIALTIAGCQGSIPIPYDEIYARGLWRADVAIADKFRSDGGRVFLAGDAAHQLSPVGGHGLNSGLGDALDLAWKLVASLQGWGGEKLLSSYDVERRQIAVENVGHVQDALEQLTVPVFAAHLKFGTETLNANETEGRRARDEVAENSKRAHWLHNQNGNILGYSYKESPVTEESQQEGERPKGTDAIYVPTTWPGSRTPHVWMKDGSSTLDPLSASAFTLVDFTEDGSWSKIFKEAAEEVGTPLQVLRWFGEEDVRKVYERDVVLVRPDMHVAWRCGEGRPPPMKKDEAAKILRKVTGWST